MPSVTVQTEDLLPALALAARAVPKRSTHLHLSNVRLTASDASQTLAILGTNLEVTARVVIDGEADGDLDVLLPATRLLAVSRAAASETITMECGGADSAAVSITIGSASCRMYPMAADQFPDMPQPGASHALCAAQPEILSRALEVAVVAAAPAAIQYAMTGVNMAHADERLEFAGTDSHRLVVSGLDSEPLGGERHDGSGILIAQAVPAIRDLCDRARGDVEVYLSERQAWFATDDATVATQLVAGNYPNYRRILPKTQGLSVRIPRAEVDHALAMVAPFASPDDGALDLACDGATWTLAARGEAGDGRVEMPGAQPPGAEATCALNHRLLSQAIANIAGSEVTLAMTPDASGRVQNPVTITSDHTHLLMPLRPRERAAAAEATPSEREA